MSSLQSLREFICERLAAAAEEIFRHCEGTIVQYEEELCRQRRLLGIRKPQLQLHQIELPQHHLRNRLINSYCKQEEEEEEEEDPEPPQMIEEQEAFFISQQKPRSSSSAANHSPPPPPECIDAGVQDDSWLCLAQQE
ncbi:hypothetical protein OJAV_G00016340 [Oryzias javanicus]|uniref:Uncharacterized protein n=1 Tax=Oryzias javanicus TaxID=123683 RepID=A0A437DKQ0_ORYJA|nr:hypothetical protein OJAV_G00016340 [Oryzias javanicus]